MLVVLVASAATGLDGATPAVDLEEQPAVKATNNTSALNVPLVGLDTPGA